MRSDRSAVDRLLRKHVEQLRSCTRCSTMHRPAISGGPIVSKVILVGQAPGDKEPHLGRPFAWTAGKTLFRWFEEAAGVTEHEFRSCIYIAAVCRCFPGKKPQGGDRVPSKGEIANCASWLRQEISILQPELIVPVGRLAIAQFLPHPKLDQVIGHQFRITLFAHESDMIPLPHPSGASPWHRMEPGRSLLKQALSLIACHPSFKSQFENFQTSS